MKKGLIKSIKMFLCFGMIVTMIQLSSIKVNAATDSIVITSQSTDDAFIFGNGTYVFVLAYTASNRSSSTLTYQWYENTTRSNQNGTPIAGETSSNYSYPTLSVGYHYYYVVINAPGCDQVVSEVITILILDTISKTDIGVKAVGKNGKVTLSIPETQNDEVFGIVQGFPTFFGGSELDYSPTPNVKLSFPSSILDGTTGTILTDGYEIPWTNGEPLYLIVFKMSSEFNGSTHYVIAYDYLTATPTDAPEPESTPNESSVPHSNYAYVDMSGEQNGARNVPYLSTNFGESNSVTYYYNTSDKNWDGTLWTSKSALKPGTYYIYAYVEELGNTTATTKFTIPENYVVPNTGIKN